MIIIDGKAGDIKRIANADSELIIEIKGIKNDRVVFSIMGAGESMCEPVEELGDFADLVFLRKQAD